MKTIEQGCLSDFDFEPNEHRPGGNRFMWVSMSNTAIGDHLRGIKCIGMPKCFDVVLIRYVDNPWHKNIHALIWSTELPEVESIEKAPVFYRNWSNEDDCFKICPSGLNYNYEQFLAHLERNEFHKMEIVNRP